MISVHWIPTHRGQEDAQRFIHWKPPFIKIVCIDERPPYLEDVPPGTIVDIRNHPMSEMYGNRGLAAIMNEIDVTNPYELYFASAYDGRYAWSDVSKDRIIFALSVVNPEQIGLEHAMTCSRMASYCVSKRPDLTYVFEGLNEPQLWSYETPDLVARYYTSFLNGLHGFGLRGVVGNFGVGWPGNGGVQDAPVQWDFFKPVIDVMLPGDYLGLHEYWALNGPQENWRWWAGRFTQCPYEVPILITECGIDTGVNGVWYGGWRDLPGNTTDQIAARYVDELYWYAEQCSHDNRVRAIFPFTYDIGGKEWEKFDIRDQVWIQAFFSKLDAEGMPWPGEYIPPPDDGGDEPVETTTWKIVAAVVDNRPNTVSYIQGVNYRIESDGTRKPMQKPVIIRWEGETNPDNYIYPEVAADGTWSFTPVQNNLRWLAMTKDPVRQIDSGWHLIDLNQRQVKMEFRWILDVVIPPVVDAMQAIRNEAWAKMGIPYNPTAAFSTYARAHALGNPVTVEFDVSGYRAQGFADAIVYAKIGDWDNVGQLVW